MTNVSTKPKVQYFTPGTEICKAWKRGHNPEKAVLIYEPHVEKISLVFHLPYHFYPCPLPYMMKTQEFTLLFCMFHTY